MPAYRPRARENARQRFQKSQLNRWRSPMVSVVFVDDQPLAHPNIGHTLHALTH